MSWERSRSSRPAASASSLPTRSRRRRRARAWPRWRSTTRPSTSARPTTRSDSTSLLDAGRAITSSLVIKDVLDTLVRTAAATLDCPEAIIFEYDAEADTLTMRSAFQERPTVYEDLDKPYAVADYPSDRAAARQQRRGRRDDLRSCPAGGCARLHGVPRREDLHDGAAQLRRGAPGHADPDRDGRRAGLRRHRARVRPGSGRTSRHGHAQRAALRERERAPPRPPESPELGAHRQGLLHDRPYGPGRRLRRAARRRAWLGRARDPAARGGDLPARHRQDRRRRPRAAQVRSADR